ncbi:MAG: DUF362 domain-containing protein [Spirochaetaceae bacterium]|nr:DUF362 domain-containing protein [Spirochaetaceae bacterium]
MNSAVSRSVKIFACTCLLAFFAAGLGAAPPARTETPGGSKVYFTQDISARGVLEAYKRLGVSVSGKVAIKLHMGEDGNTNYLRPELLRDLVTSVKGTFADSNTLYGGKRSTTQGHLAVAKDHGFTYAPVDILDSNGETRLPVKGGKRLSEILVGANITGYDWIISVTHFKGHAMAGFGGSFKNMAVGIASPAGKRAIHAEGPNAGMFSSSGEAFFEKVIEYNKGLIDAMNGKVLYINILNNLSVDCDCNGHAAKPEMKDLGILASTDPVALEKASLDLIYTAPETERAHLVERMESRNGIYQIIYAEKLGLGSQKYELIRF